MRLLCVSPKKPYLCDAAAQKQATANSAVFGIAIEWSLHRTRGYVHYEYTNHLGNVLAVATDRKLSLPNGTFYKSDILSLTDYYAFGQAMPGREYHAGAYKYGYNGKENDPETKYQDYGFRLYDPRLCRFPTVDPLTKSYPELTPYQFASNTPVQAIDLDGLEAVVVNSDKSVDIFANIFIVNDVKDNRSVGSFCSALEITISADIINQVNGEKGLKGIPVFGDSYKATLHLTVTKNLTYEEAVELKNSDVDGGTENGALVNDNVSADNKWRHNVIVYRVEEGSREYKDMVNSGMNAYYKTDYGENLKTIAIRNPSKVEIDKSKYSPEKKLSISFLHEMGHFLFQLCHPGDKGCENDNDKKSITAERDDDIELSGKNIDFAKQKQDANHIYKVGNGIIKVLPKSSK